MATIKVIIGIIALFAIIASVSAVSNDQLQGFVTGDLAKKNNNPALPVLIIQARSNGTVLTVLGITTIKSLTPAQLETCMIDLITVATDIQTAYPKDLTRTHLYLQDADEMIIGTAAF